VSGLEPYSQKSKNFHQYFSSNFWGARIIAADQSARHDQMIAFLGSIDESLEQISGKE